MTDRPRSDRRSKDTTRAIVLLLVLALSAACSGGASPTAPTDAPVATPNGTMSATIDGVRWNATVISPVYAPGDLAGPTLIVVASNASPASGATTGLTLYLVGVPGPGVYPVAEASEDVPVAVVAIVASLSGTPPAALQEMAEWGTPVAGSESSVTLTTLSTAGATGTFSFTLTSAAGAQQSAKPKSVTNGVFNLTFSR